jgi:hypothetical protein
MNDHLCDRCGTEVPNGSGYYPNGDTGDRVCRECSYTIMTDHTTTGDNHMKYTHYWYLKLPTTRTTTRAHALYVALMRDARALAHTAEVERGIFIAGLNGRELPQWKDGYFLFNGKRSESCDTFCWLQVPVSVKVGGNTDFNDDTLTFSASCKTNRLPYDALVTAVLLRACDYYGDELSVVSDGTWDEWEHGRELYHAHFGYAPSSPLPTLVA